jgi:pimeloyl-ACP methyl ester carboxylesterase
MRRLLAVAGLLGLVAGGLTASTGAQAQQTRGTAVLASISWGTCADATLAARGAKCGFVTVPLDYAKPGAGTVRLAVSRVRHTVPDPQYQGVMLVNPGGPGGSGLALATIGALVPGQVGASYDWIGFDPRGVGASTPTLSCDGDYFDYHRPAYVPTTAAIEKAWQAKAAGYAHACAQAGGPLLDHLKTADSARDLDRIRAALGQRQINYYGFSYGTYLGQVYATLFPQRVRRMVLDGNVDPRGVWYSANLTQDLAFERNMRIYFGWLAKYDSVYHLGKTAGAVRKLFYSTQAALIRKPAGGQIGGSELTDVFLQAGYFVFSWEDVAAAFAAWIQHRDATKLKALYDKGQQQGPGADNSYAIYLGVQCTDAKWPAAWRTWQADNWQVHSRAPFETWGNAWYNAPCRSWAGRPGTPVRVNGTQAPPILLVSETRDAATPYAGSLQVRRLFPRSALVEGVGGTTHAGSLFGDTCVDGTIASYLGSGAMPRRVRADRSDKQCTPIAQPDPTRAAKATERAAVVSRLDLQRLIGR